MTHIEAVGPDETRGGSSLLATLIDHEARVGKCARCIHTDDMISSVKSTVAQMFRVDVAYLDAWTAWAADTLRDAA